MMKQEQVRAARGGRVDVVRRVRRADVEWVAERLSERDWQIIEATNRLRLVSGKQLERLYFHALSGHAREVVRGRVLRRLVRWKVLTVLPRRVGGAARGSAGSVFALGNAGARLSTERQSATTSQPRVRRPGAPTERTTLHTLAISELYADLVEQARTLGAHVLTYAAEPACWWPNGVGGYLKPDAYTLLAREDVREHWWIEVDLATESLPTIRRKLRVYLDFAVTGQLGPRGLMPRILVTAPTPGRCVQVRSAVLHLPAPASELFVVLPYHASAAAMLRSLGE